MMPYMPALLFLVIIFFLIGLYVHLERKKDARYIQFLNDLKQQEEKRKFLENLNKQVSQKVEKPLVVRAKGGRKKRHRHASSHTIDTCRDSSVYNFSSSCFGGSDVGGSCD